MPSLSLTAEDYRARIAAAGRGPLRLDLPVREWMPLELLAAARSTRLVYSGCSGRPASATRTECSRRGIVVAVRWVRFQINFRNHRKIVVIDGKVGFIGGLNVGDEYMSKGPLSPWRDTHMRVAGPMVQSIQLAWVQDWNWAGGAVPELEWQPVPSPAADKVAIIVPTGPAETAPVGSTYATHVVNSAQRRLWIATPYFIPDPPAVRALGLAAARGVDVRIIIPELCDSAAVRLASYTFYEPLADAGVKFLLRSPGFMHQKVILVDDDFASIGTFNFDVRSFSLNFEIVGALIDRDFAGEVEKMLEVDLAHCRELERKEYVGRSIWFRLKVRLSFLFSQTM